MTEVFSEPKTGRSIFLFSTTPLLFVAVILLFPSPSAAIECISCNSFNNTGCDKGDVSQYKMQCSGTYNGCRKWYFFFDEKGDGHTEERVARQCAVVKELKCIRGFGASGKRFSRVICDCMHDNCNTAAKVKVNLIMVASALVPFMVQVLDILL
ncbi:hypothetical protein EGW08_017026 [Elysia chlorotica]|uniref:Protein quiver n=1 Tax=Elysia chlorotica TaxID=188477 RepID=A0A3S1B3H6_ELYCH|nr:hypothetical protein EGW08_017026 [Elysia chlorotica]